MLAGIILYILGLALTNTQRISPSLLLGLIVILIGLVVAGPWFTAQAARLATRFRATASSVLAARRLADNPKAAFRSVRGLVLAVFLGTMLAGLLPAVDAISATPSATALSNVLLAGFISAPVCGDNANCTGNFGPGDTQAGATALQQRIASEGLPPQAAAALLSGLRAMHGATAIPIYSPAQQGNPVPTGPGANGGFGIISCAGLRELAVLGECAPGRSAVVVQAASLFDDNPRFSTQPIASPSSPAAPAGFGNSYLQALLVKVNSAATLERVRTYLVTHATESASGTAPRTFGEAVQARAAVADTVQRLIYIAVVLTLIVAGCSLAVAVGGSLVERKRPFTLLRVTGTPSATLYRVVFLEAVLPLVAATVVAAGVGYGMSVLTVSKMAPAGTPVPVPGHAYFLTMAVGLVVSLLVILASLPLLGRVTAPGNVRFE